MEAANSSPDAAARGVRLVDDLAAEMSHQGYVTDDRWRAALRAVPRHRFVPETGWATPEVDGHDPYPIDRGRDAVEWLAAVYSDTGIVTQINDGATDPATGEGLFTSSVSAPGIVCQFLELLDVRVGHRVLEIGTGSGWTAALLSWRLGADNVVTVEVDSHVAAQARTNLARFAIKPTTIIGDGAKGARSWAPYDRVHVTCGVSRVPYAWVEQTRVGGVIVAPFHPGYGFGHRLRLDVVDGGDAVGRFHGPAGYMMMRSQRPKHGKLASFLHHEADAEHTRTRMDPRTVTGLSPGGDLAISALAPGIRGQLGNADDGTGEATLWLLETTPDAHLNGSWALAEYVPGHDTYEVIQYGPRRLWDEVHRAYLKWVEWGRPDRDRFGLIIEPGLQAIWLDQPHHMINPVFDTTP